MPPPRHAYRPRRPVRRVLVAATGTLGLTVGLVAALSGATTPGYAAVTAAPPQLAAAASGAVPRTEDAGLVELARDRAAAAQAVLDAQRTADAERASRDAARAALPQTVVPVDGPVTSPFGSRWGRLHAGLDFGVPVGTPVRAATDAVVVSVAYDAGGNGTHLTLQLADGTTAVYGHLSQALVTAGPVTAGQVIGLSGNTGHSTGPHLHFELRTGDAPFDPRPWLAARGVVV